MIPSYFRGIALLFFSIVSCCNCIRAQDNINLPPILPPSPDAAAFARYGEIPVDYNTGVALTKIDIPIYTLHCGKLDIPISLSYHSAGIRVRDIASTVGVGLGTKCGRGRQQDYNRIPGREGNFFDYSSIKTSLGFDYAILEGYDK